MSKWLRKDDKVLVIAGNEKGKIGTVLGTRKSRVLVQGVNYRKKHVKQRDENAKGGIIEMEAPLHVSNVRHCDPDGKPLKLKVKVSDSGEKSLYYLDEGKEVTFRVLKQAKNSKK